MVILYGPINAIYVKCAQELDTQLQHVLTAMIQSFKGKAPPTALNMSKMV